MFIGSIVNAIPKGKIECDSSDDCPSINVCISKSCVDPCPGICGLKANCIAEDHIPICSCPDGYNGDPFIACISCNYEIRIWSIFIEIIPFNCLATEAESESKSNPCKPSPCGDHSNCKAVGSIAACACLPNFLDRPPNCRAECDTSAECVSKKACIRNKCADPCPGACGINANCNAIDHRPVCACEDGFIGDPFAECVEGSFLIHLI